MFERLRALWHRRRPLDVWHHDEYRMPVASAESTLGLETRRADDALFFLLTRGAIAPALRPSPVSFAQLLQVHTPDYLESLTHPAALASIFAADPADFEVEPLLRTLRLACGGTVEAAHRTLARKVPSLNLLGGFHHAAPDRGSGFCAINDVAVAIADVRATGLEGQVVVLDLDCHPPDGTAACVGRDLSVWVGSLSGMSWGPLPGVDETVLERGCGDAAYLAALEGLLGRMPPPVLALVIAGGDVIGGDRLGVLGLTLDGARQRDLAVARALDGLPQVWLPAGGYGPHAWKVLAGTGLALSLESDAPIPLHYDPLAARFSAVAHTLKAGDLGSEPLLTEADLAETFGQGRPGPRKLLGFYSTEGVEYALERYGLLPVIRRLGYRALRVSLEQVGSADRARLFGVDARDGKEALLVELELERKTIAGGNFLFVNWLSLRNPRARFSPQRPQLPGQEVPGLGLAREMTQLLGLIAERLVLDGVAFRPSWYHMAYAARHSARFVNAQRQGRFEALVRDLKAIPLLEATRAVAEGRVRVDGAPYAWEAEEMVQWRHPELAPRDAEEIAREREARHFTLSEAPSSPAAPEPRAPSAAPASGG